MVKRLFNIRRFCFHFCLECVILLFVTKGVKMNKIDIVRAQSSDDCNICDQMLSQLFKQDSGFDATINPEAVVEGINQAYLKYSSVYLAYAVADDKPVGYLMGNLKSPKGQNSLTNIVTLDSIFVVRENRDSGVGKALVADFEKWANDKFAGNFVIEASAFCANDDGAEFYKSLGFKPVKTIFRK